MGLGMSALLLIAALTGCGQHNRETASNEISVSQTDSHYPVTVESYNYAGDVVTTTYEKAPERVDCCVSKVPLKRCLLWD